MSHLKLQNKVRIAIVLCLSSICVILSIVRLAAGMHRNVFGKWQFGMAWISFMLHCEAAIAVMAGSIPALRAVYTSHRSRKSTEAHHEKKPENLKGKALRVLGSMRRKETPSLPTYVPPVRPRASIAKWRQSIVGIIPRRAGSRREGHLAVVSPENQRNSAAESVVIHPGLAYHNYRKQERSGTRVTQETTVSSDKSRSKYMSADMSEVSAAQ
ncbi:hypothetical protein N0V90_009192 [Kalmusia sp. IMI 367209]|nr:hypothetical protein N0V90_009192 [Kalmusia sp. IMI 367209]